MTKFTLVFLLAHIMGDYYLQTDSMCQRKKEDYKWLIIHSIVYTIPYWCILFLVKDSSKLILPIILLGLLHGMIDLLKIKRLDLIINAYLKKIHLNANLSEKKMYIIDQLLHIISIYCICLIFLYGVVPTPTRCLEMIMNLVSLNLTDATKYAILLLTICKPVNITFAILFSDFKPKKSAQNENTLDHIYDPIKKAGSYIGLLERIIIVIFIYLQAYSAIGFVITAKSVARYDNITKDQQFAEYFLIGTLYSIASCLILYWLLFFLI